MACECIPTLEKSLTDKANEPGTRIKKPGKALKCRSVIYNESAFNVGTGRVCYLLPFSCDWEMQDGGTRAGIAKVEMSHCPFCGKPFHTEPVPS